MEENKNIDSQQNNKSISDTSEVEPIILSKDDWDAINGREKYTEPITPIDQPDSKREEHILPMDENLGETKRFYAQSYIYGKENEGYDDYDDTPRKPLKPSNSKIVNWWRNQPIDTKVMTGFITILIPVFLIGLCLVISSTKTVTTTDLVLKDYKQKYELGETVKVDLKKYVDIDEQPSSIDTNSIELYSTLFTNTSKYTYNESTGEVVSKGKEFLEAGTYSITIQYKKNGSNKERDVTFKVKDSVAPEFEDFNSSVYVVQNAKSVNFSNYFEATDKSETAVISTDAVSSVNLAKVGVYEMKVTVKDSSDNETVQTCRVHVISADDVKNGKKLTAMKDGTIPMGDEDVSESALKKNAERKKELQEEVENLKSQLTQYNSELEASKKNIASINAQIEKYNKLLTQEQAKVAKYEQAVTDAQNAIDNATQSDDMVDLEKKLADAKYQYQQALNNSRINEYQTKLNGLNDDLYYAQINQTNIQTNIDSINSSISSDEAEMKAL